MNVVLTKENKGKKITEMRERLCTIRNAFSKGNLDSQSFFSEEKKIIETLENLFISKNMEEVLF